MNPTKIIISSLFTALALNSVTSAQAQTVRYQQTFNTLNSGALWKYNLDSAKPSAHPENIYVTAGCGQDGSNCLKEVYRHNDGIHKQPQSNPVFLDTNGVIGWAPSDATHTNTATDVIQANLMISGNTAGNGKATDTPIPNKAYTLTYKVFFEPGFDFAKGGKLPGLAAKTFDSGCSEDTNNKRSGSNWSVRLMWRANGRVELYSYDQSRPSGGCGLNTMIDYVEGEPLYEVPGTIPQGSTKFRFVPGVWYTVTLGVKVNDNNSVVYKLDANGNRAVDALGDPIVVSGNGAEYLKIEGSDGSSRSLIYNNVALRDECNGACPSNVPDTPATWVNGLFFSSFHGGNEVKRVQCLNMTAPSFPGLTQSRYDELCASQRNAAIFPEATWNPQVYTAARFDDFKIVDGFPTATDTTAPSTPAGLSATATSSSQVNLSWSASSDNIAVTGYSVYRAGILVGSTNAPFFSDSGLAAATTYSYNVKANDAAGNLSAGSNSASVTTPAIVDTTAPTAPANLSATAVSTSQINLSWLAATDNVGVTGYTIYQSGVLVGSTTSVSYSVIGLNPSTAYSYSVKATDGAGNFSAASNTATATTSAGNDTTAPSVPANLVATAGSGSQINLSWSASTDNVAVSGYRVYRGTVLVGSPTATSYTDTGLNAATAYSYTVKAVDAAGNLSLSSNSASATTPPSLDTAAPSAPANLSATPASSSQINLSWNASTDNVAVTGYKIYRGSILAGSSTSTSYSDTGLSASTLYSYRVVATDAAGNLSGASNISSATTTAASVTIASDNFDSNSLSGGTGWVGGWVNADSSNGGLDGLAKSGPKSMYVEDSTGVMTRTVNLLGKTGVRIKFNAYKQGIDAGEKIEFRVFDGTWRVLKVWVTANPTDVWTAEEFDLSSYAMTSNFQIQFKSYGSSGTDQLNIDDVVIFVR